MKLGSINICGLSDRSKFTLDKYVDSKQFDALFVQETNRSDLEKLKLTNMKVIMDDNKASNKGAALYVNRKFTITKLKEINEISKNIDASWGLGEIKKKRYILGSVYVKLEYHNAITDVIKMLEKAHSLMKKLKAVGVILSGDFNARHVAWGDHTSNPYGKQLIEKLDMNKFAISTSASPTFLSTNGSSYIDLTIMTTNLVEKVISCETDTNIELYSGAPFRGHVPLLTNFSTDGCVTNKSVIEKINLDKICWDKWSEDLDSKICQSEDYLNNITDPQVLSDFIDRTIQTVTNNLGEKKIISTHSKPYWTPELSTLCDKMKEARKAYFKRNTDVNDEKLKQAKQAFDEARKRECESFILNKTKDMNSAQRLKFWKEFNKLFKKQTDPGIEPLLDANGNILTSNHDLEECMFSTFFEGKHLDGVDFDNTFYEETNRIYEEIIQRENAEESEDDKLKDLNANITIEEIKVAIKSYNASGKSADKEQFNPKMFKHLSDRVLKYIQKLANQCLDEGKWIWNKAEVIFLRKAGKDTYSKPGAYRPISISSYIGKLIEKIIAKRIQKYLNLIGLHDPDQEGFMEGRNTIRYLNRLVLSIKSDMQKKLTSICLFIDFEKAFDSVWKKGLIVKLHNLGIRGKILYLLNDFLMNRKITLNINGVVGNIRNGSDVGVPQGSALSPILFRIFVMDLAAELTNRGDISILKFADDGTIRVTSNSTPACLETLQYILTTVNLWTYKWRMVINCQPNKTEVIGFSTAEGDRSLIPDTFKLGEATINRVPQTKVLGLVLDENLSFTEHSKEVYKKLVRLWAMISQHSNRHWGFNKATMVQIIKTLFLPTLLYAGHIWINQHNMKEINSLYYKILKSTVGAVLNIRQTYAEVILGLPPINIVNEINKVKHYLKVNMTKLPEDRLRDLIQREIENNPRSQVYHSIRLVFKYLKWKLHNYPDSVDDSDTDIIDSGNIEEFFNISPETCKYTKGNIVKYTEYMWKRSVQNELQQEGYSGIPEPKCSSMPTSIGLKRQEEVMVMSMFYPNNTLNSFLHTINSEKFPTPICHCGESSQTAHHVLFNCSTVDEALRLEAYSLLQQVVGDQEAEIENHLVLMKARNSKTLMNVISEIVIQQMNHLNVNIDL